MLPPSLERAIRPGSRPTQRRTTLASRLRLAAPRARPAHVERIPAAPSEAVMRAAVDAVGRVEPVPELRGGPPGGAARFAGVLPEDVDPRQWLDRDPRCRDSHPRRSEATRPSSQRRRTRSSRRQTRLNRAHDPRTLTDDVGLDIPAIVASITPRTKVIFLSSPNNPTGNSWTGQRAAHVLATEIPSSSTRRTSSAATRTRSRRWWRHIRTWS